MTEPQENYYRGLSALKANNLEAARSYLSNISDGEYADRARLFFGLSYFLANDFQEAITHFEKIDVDLLDSFEEAAGLIWLVRFFRNFTMREIPLSDIERVHSTDVRANQYSADMNSGDTFPPVRLLWDGRRYMVIDGHHRIAAAEQLGKRSISSIVHLAPIELVADFLGLFVSAIQNNDNEHIYSTYMAQRLVELQTA